MHKKLRLLFLFFLILLISNFCLSSQINTYNQKNLSLQKGAKDNCNSLNLNNLSSTDKTTLIAIRSATVRFENYTKIRTDKIYSQTMFGPNFDGAYYYRFSSEIYGDSYGYNIDSLSKQRDYLLKLQKNLGIKKYFLLPSFESLSAEELNLFFLSNLSGSLKSDRNQYIIIKHFPGSNEIVELSESKDVILNQSYYKMKQSYLKPFILAIDSNLSFDGIMVSHIKYPLMEKDLRSICYNTKEMPEAKAFYNKNNNFTYPSSLSPFVSRCLLRNLLRFDGVIYADWYSMAQRPIFISIEDFGKSVINKLSSGSLTFVLANYAGINFMVAANPDHKEIKNYIKTNPDFLNVINDNVNEKINLLIKNSSEPCIKDLSYDTNRLKNDFDYKLKFIYAHPVYDFTSLERSKSCLLKLEANYFDYTDPWNRGAILLLVYRKYIVEELTKKKYPELIPISGDEKAWIYELSKTDFFEKYNQINWNSLSFKKSQCILAKEIKLNN
ncbi:MAG: glycoside hydrolase family 3 N-terminal domain-containing protein [archaeon]